MSRELALLALFALITVGMFGWGSAIVTRVLGPTETSDATNLVPVRIAVGLAFFIGVGGLLVAVDAARFPELAALILLGVVLAVLPLVRHRQGAMRLRPLRVVLFSVASLVVATLAYANAAVGPINVNDDDPGYLYLAKRLLETGGMIDPFNLRRLTSYGGGELLSAVALRVAGPGSVLAIEWFGWLLLCIALVVGGTQRRFAPVVVLLLGGAVVLFRPIGIWANSGPTFSGVALNVALFMILAGQRESGSRRRFFLVGLILGALMALRLEFLAPGLVATCFVAARTLGVRKALGAIGAAFGVGVLALLGWAVALERSSSTPLFPLLQGNWNPNYPWNDPTIKGIGGLAHRVGAEFGIARIGITLLVGVIALGISLVLARREAAAGQGFRAAHAALLGALIGTAAEIVLETPSLTGSSIDDVGRYDAPEALACLLFALALLWRHGEAMGRGAASGQLIRSARPWLVSATAIAAVLVSFGVTPASSATELKGAFDATSSLRSGTGFADTWTHEQASYNRVSAAVPASANVLAAVDYPGLLDFNRFSFATLDIVGAASPSPGIPVLKGEPAVVSYLRNHGYAGVVASFLRSPGLYRRVQWQTAARTAVPVYRAEARQFLAWFRDLQAMRTDPKLQVRTVGAFFYISLDPTSGQAHTR